MPEIVQIFAINLRSLREGRNWSRQKLGDESRVSPSTIKGYEHGLRWPELPYILALAKCLQVPAWKLFERPNRASQIEEQILEGSSKLTATVLTYHTNIRNLLSTSIEATNNQGGEMKEHKLELTDIMIMLTELIKKPMFNDEDENKVISAAAQFGNNVVDGIKAMIRGAKKYDSDNQVQRGSVKQKKTMGFR